MIVSRQLFRETFNVVTRMVFRGTLTILSPGHVLMTSSNKEQDGTLDNGPFVDNLSNRNIEDTNCLVNHVSVSLFVMIYVFTYLVVLLDRDYKTLLY